jgi:uncharacterized protein (TIGR03435 family)
VKQWRNIEGIKRPRITAIGGAIVIGLLNGCLLCAQPATLPAFDVASVKPHKPDDTRRGFPQFLAGGRFTSAGVPLRMLIAIAYNVGPQSVRLMGGPGWISSAEGVYDIEATSTSPGKGLAEKRLMLQTLLADRFKLKIHVETKLMPIYAVVVAKNGPKLQKARIEEKDCPGPETPEAGGVSCHSMIGGRGRGLHGEALSVSDVARFVENWTDRPLVDKTGIQGLFNIQTRGWAPLQPGPPPTPGTKAEDGSDAADVPTLFTVFEQLGLKLESQKGAADIFVIDHVEKPSEN